MRIPRVYVDTPLEPETELELPAAAARHVARVLRRRAGDPLVLFDGGGGELPARIDSITRGRVRVTTATHDPVERESPLAVVLAQGISRSERMDYTIQKAVELGIARIVPLLTERTVVRLDAERRAKRERHWQGVIASACEQCGRNRLPALEPVQPLAEWLAHAPAGGTRLLLQGRAEAPLAGAGCAAPVLVLIGPEGGLNEDEVASARAGGFRCVRLGPRVLRTETAAVAALAALQVLWGDLGGSG